jgi:hypothetical protein
VSNVSFMGLTDVTLSELEGIAQLSPNDPDVSDKFRGVLGIRRAVVLLASTDRQHWHTRGDDLRHIHRQARATLRTSLRSQN